MCVLIVDNLIVLNIQNESALPRSSCSIEIALIGQLSPLRESSTDSTSSFCTGWVTAANTNSFED